MSKFFLDTELGRLKYNRQLSGYRTMIDTPLFGENTISVDSPRLLENFDITEILSTFRRNDSIKNKDMQVTFGVNREAGKFGVIPRQLETIAGLTSKAHVIEKAVLKNIPVVMEGYFDHLLSNVDHQISIEVQNYLKRGEILKHSFTPSALHVLGADRDCEGFLSIDFDCSWDLEHGFSMLFDGDTLVELGGIADFCNY